MMYDTVREELQTKITPGVRRLSMTIETVAPESKLAVESPEPVEVKAPEASVAAGKVSWTKPPVMKEPEQKAALPAVKRTQTAGLSAPKTSPTLVEFQNKNASLPDWRR